MAKQRLYYYGPGLGWVRVKNPWRGTGPEDASAGDIVRHWIGKDQWTKPVLVLGDDGPLVADVYTNRIGISLEPYGNKSGKVGVCCAAVLHFRVGDTAEEEAVFAPDLIHLLRALAELGFVLT